VILYFKSSDICPGKRILAFVINYSKMRKLKLVKGLVVIAGMIGVTIGGALLFNPVAFEASAGISLEENINMLSEVRAPGGALFVIATT
jgi:hypothetical protein